MGLKVSDGVVENCVPGMNECSINKSFDPKDEARTIFKMISNAHGDINLPCAEKEL